MCDSPTVSLESRTRRFWGWGYEDAGPGEVEMAAIEAALVGYLGMADVKARPRPRLADLSLRPGRCTLPKTLEHLGSSSPFERALHSYGRSYRDLVRTTAGRFEQPPDLVVFPQDEEDVARVLDYASDAALAVIPFGGGSSVCGGVEPRVGESFRGTLSLDLGKLRRVLEVDRSSRAVRVQAGVLGPDLETQLAPHGFSLRHYPQSFEFSSVGGWIATRAGGHFATVYTHIDDLVEGLRVVTPRGLLETRRLPASGAGPDPNRLFLGSEGIFGVITEAWLRVFQRPTFRAKAVARFPNFLNGAVALRTLSQSGLFPSNARLVDPLEAMLNGVGTGEHAILLLGFESHDHDLTPWLSRGIEICRDAGGTVSEESVRIQGGETREGSQHGDAGAWRQAFLRAPYLRDELVLRDVFVETFETAVVWSRFEELHAQVTQAARDVLGQACAVTCRITHVYPDGPAPYFTVIAPARVGAELGQWSDVKEAMTAAMLSHGGTTTHHHAVGRDFVPYYERERPDLFASALRASKAALDPRGVCNPGVLLRP